MGPPTIVSISCLSSTYSTLKLRKCRTFKSIDSRVCFKNICFYTQFDIHISDIPIPRYADMSYKELLKVYITLLNVIWNVCGSNLQHWDMCMPGPTYIPSLPSPMTKNLLPDPTRM